MNDLELSMKLATEEIEAIKDSFNTEYSDIGETRIQNMTMQDAINYWLILKSCQFDMRITAIEQQLHFFECEED